MSKTNLQLFLLQMRFSWCVEQDSGRMRGIWIEQEMYRETRHSSPIFCDLDESSTAELKKEEM